mgnify:CR=1 FL=1
MEQQKDEKIIFCKGGGCTAKLGAGILSRVLERLPKGPADENLLIGYDSKDDAAVYRISDDTAIVQTLDFFPPMVDDPYTFGKIAAANALSDIYAMGGEVKTALNIVCFPESMDLNVLGEIMRGGSEKVTEAGGTLAGGHSIADADVKYGLSVMGTVHPDKIYPNNQGRPGDKLILTKKLGVGIVCTANRVKEASDAAMEQAVASMTMLNKSASHICHSYEIHACTDVTGFGFLGHLHEMMDGKLSCRIFADQIPVIKEALDYADEFLLTAAGQKNRNHVGEFVSFENVSFAYTGQEHDGLRDINLRISDGECVLFCGRSGCGKTTITRLVNGLIPQFYQGELRGRVLVDGQEISNIPMYQIAAKVGSVFQNPRTQFFNVDTDSEIAFGIENEARPPKALAERVEQTAKDLQIQNLRNRNIFELSGGEKQKIAFASVYAMNPKIYLLDEPSSNLDMTSIQKLKKHLQLIKKQGKTVLIAEHRLYYLMELADRIVYLEKGEIKGIYTPEEFRQLLEHDREQMGLRAVDLQTVFPPKIHSPAPAPALELRNVTLRYKKQTILHDIVLSAGKGEVIGVVGHNGAGKTTFSRALCGLHKDCEGQFLWEGKPMERKARLKRSYMVMQDVNYELFADSVEAECSFGIRNPDQTLVNATLEELGLSPYREQHPNTLSGGQKQRVAVAVSMICGKDLLVFDEPTSGLDFDSMTQVAGLIRRLSDMGKVIFIVTHDFEFVCRTCSRVLHFDEGEMPDDVPVTMDALPKLRELFSVSDGKER